MADIVIREVAKGVSIFSRPFTRNGFLPFGGRSTAVRLNSGDVWVLASTPLSAETKETIDKMGPVKWIVTADGLHHIFLKEFKDSYPEAKVIGIENLVEVKKKEGWSFDGVYGVDPPETAYGFEDEIKAQYFPAFKNKDVAFLHLASKSLIVGDLLFNLPGKEQYSKSTKSANFPGIGGLSPYSAFHRFATNGMVLDKEQMKRDATAVANWGFERIIPCHGDVIETDAKKAWNSVFRAYVPSA